MKPFISYKLKTQVENIGSIRLQIECLEDLNQTIDDVFEFLQKTGRESELEQLCPYFGTVWPSARGLAQFIAALPEPELKDRNVLEVGCGLAIPSMVAALRGAAVLATDFHPAVPEFLNKNLVLNQIENLKYATINWEAENAPHQQFDWVIGSDILYEQRYAKTLAKTISKLIKPAGQIVISDPGRPYLQNFCDEMKGLGFTYDTRILKVFHTPAYQEVFVIRFQKQTP